MTVSESVVLADVDSALVSAAQGQPEAHRVVTATQVRNGECHVLSRFGNSVWRLPDFMFPTSVKDSEKQLEWARIPSVFRSTIKAAVLRYYLYGREDGRIPRGTTLRLFFGNLTAFVRFLDERGATRLGDVNELLCSQYVERVRKDISKKNGERLRTEVITQRLIAVEHLHWLSQHTADPMPHPWPDASAMLLSGQAGATRVRAKTAVIPDEVLSKLFCQAHGWLEHADRNVAHRTALAELEVQGVGHKTIRKRLAQRGYNGTIPGIKKESGALTDACMVVVLITSGIRVSELVNLRRGGAYTTVGEDGERYHWIKGCSEKTHEGETSWLVPQIAHQAIDVAERLSEPLAQELETNIEALCRDNPHCAEAEALKRHRDAVFLSRQPKKGWPVTTLSGKQVQNRVNRFAAAHGHDWHFTPHQFRRTFAVYAARSAYGDLRYLKKHFKHWSLDMTALYALDERQDLDIYDEIYTQVRDAKISVVEHWLDNETPLSGGMAEPIRSFRPSREQVSSYGSRREMAEKVSEHVYLRATGVGWCTADFGGCNGGHGIEKTKCGACANSVIDETKQRYWEEVYLQSLELRELDDVGPGGRQRVERDIERCEKVLTELGSDVVRLGQAANDRTERDGSADETK